MLPSSLCRPWQPDRAANAAQDNRSYTTAWGTICSNYQHSRLRSDCGVNTLDKGVVSRLGEWIGYREETKRHGSISEVRVALQFRSQSADAPSERSTRA